MTTTTPRVSQRRRPRRAAGRAALGLALLVAMGVLSAIAPAARAVGPCTETAYANGQQFCIFVTKIIATPSAGLLATAEPIYIAAYSPLPAGCDTTNPATCGPETLPSGYVPLCDPCFHGGALDAFPYHDHVMEGAPGFGNHGTADGMKGPWILILVAYDPAVSNQARFTPYKSTADLRAGEAAGDFVTLNPGSSNPYEINTGVVIIFGVQPLG